MLFESKTDLILKRNTKSELRYLIESIVNYSAAQGDNANIYKIYNVS